MNKEKSIYKGLIIFATIGIVLSTYLLYSYFTRPDFQPCSINATINCDAVIKGEVSTTFGIPTALYGFVGYMAILLAAIFKKKKVLLGFATFGMLFCLRITYIEVVILKVLCPICIACQLVMLAVFSLGTRLNFKKDLQ